MVRNEKFDYNRDTDEVRLFNIEEVLFIVVQKKNSLVFSLTYAFYVNGPFLVGVGKVDQIKISGKSYPVKIRNDPNASQERFKYLEFKKMNQNFVN